MPWYAIVGIVIVAVLVGVAILSLRRARCPQCRRPFDNFAIVHWDGEDNKGKPTGGTLRFYLCDTCRKVWCDEDNFRGLRPARDDEITEFNLRF